MNLHRQERTNCAAKRTTALSLLACLGMATGCGASFSPPGRGDVGFAVTQAMDGHHEVEALYARVEKSDDSVLDDFAYQLTWRAPVANETCISLSYFGHDLPGDEYGWGQLSAAAHRRFGADTDPLKLTAGIALGAGVGGRWPGFVEGDRRFPRTLTTGIDLGLAWQPQSLPAFRLFVEQRIQRSHNDSGRARHQPPATTWWQTSAGARVDYGQVFGSLALVGATYTNHHSDGAHGPIAALALGYRFSGIEPPSAPSNQASEDRRW